MSSEDNKALVRRMFAELNQGHLAVIDELVAPEYVEHIAGGQEIVGPAGLKQFIAQFATAFPDLHCTIEDEISEGDKVAAHWTMRGTHKGPLLGNRPTSRPIVVQGMIFAHTENGQIAEGWTLLDQMSLLQQLGIVPPPHSR